jgi:hypothetical protein
VITVERHEPAVAGPVVVTAADMVAGHVVLDVSCLDRLYLNGYVSKLQAFYRVLRPGRADQRVRADQRADARS